MFKADVFCIICFPLLAVVWSYMVVEVVVSFRAGQRLGSKQLEVGSFQISLVTEGGIRKKPQNKPFKSSRDLLSPEASRPYCTVTLKAGKQELLSPLPKTLPLNPSSPQIPHLHTQDILVGISYVSLFIGRETFAMRTG